MNALHSFTLPASLILELAAHLRATKAPFNLDEAARRAVRAWITSEESESSAAARPLRGYQWKCLFLPEGSNVRMTHGGNNHYAKVEGEHLRYQGSVVSPRQFTRAVAGDGHNAWRALWVQFPGENQWRLASTLRRALATLAHRTAPTPFEAFSHAADNMRKAMHGTLQLLDQAAAAHAQRLERRASQYRRSTDAMGGDQPYDD